jgi:hypothetical protein
VVENPWVFHHVGFFLAVGGVCMSHSPADAAAPSPRWLAMETVNNRRLRRKHLRK